MYPSAFDWQLSNRQTNFGLRVAAATTTAAAATSTPAATQKATATEWTNFYAQVESLKLSVGQGVCCCCL